jgi:hypothetical protein
MRQQRKMLFMMIFSFWQQLKPQFKMISSATGSGDKNKKDFENN